jgi:hypothetical protein
MRLAWLVVLLGACEMPVGGMLLTVEGAVQPDQLRLTASFDKRQVVRVIPETPGLGPMALPTDLFATFSDQSAMVALGVEALAAGKTIASAALPPISVDPGQVVRTTAQLVAVTPVPEPPKGDNPGGGAPAMPNKPTYPQVVLADMPIAYYRLDETVGTAAVDATGHGLNATYGAQVRRGAPGLVVGSTGGASFGGGGWASDRFIVAPPSPQLEPRMLSLEMWLRPDTFVDPQFNYPALLAYGEPYYTPDGPIWGTLLSDNGLGTHMWTDYETAYTSAFATVTRPAVGQIYHFVLTWDGVTVRMYINGTLESQRPLRGSLVTHLAHGGLGIGAYPDPAPGDVIFAGTIDEVAIYGTALTPQQVRAHYTAGTVP